MSKYEFSAPACQNRNESLSVQLRMVWFSLVISYLVGGAVAFDSYRTAQSANFESPEDFKRTDVVELMEALCLMNPEMRCPNPYTLPGYLYDTEILER